MFQDNLRLHVETRGMCLEARARGMHRQWSAIGGTPIVAIAANEDGKGT